MPGFIIDGVQLQNGGVSYAELRIDAPMGVDSFQYSILNSNDELAEVSIQTAYDAGVRFFLNDESSLGFGLSDTPRMFTISRDEQVSHVLYFHDRFDPKQYMFVLGGDTLPLNSADFPYSRDQGVVYSGITVDELGPQVDIPFGALPIVRQVPGISDTAGESILVLSVDREFTGLKIGVSSQEDAEFIEGLFGSVQPLPVSEFYVALQSGAVDGIYGASTILDTLDFEEIAPFRPIVPQLAAAVTRLGTGSDEVFVGGGNADRLSGGEGADTLFGFEGADTLAGGAGDDLIFGHSDDDTITNDLRDVVFGGDGDDTIFGGYGNDELRGDAGNDVIAGGSGADTVIGGTGDDVLTGSALGDIIFGSDGNDFVNGGFGFDRVNGGVGADEFYHLGIANHGSDWIQDYDAAEGDVLVFGNASATLAQFQINTTTTPTAGVDDVEEAFIIYRPTGQIMWALVDGDGQEQINLQIGGDVFDLMG